VSLNTVKLSYVTLYIAAVGVAWSLRGSPCRVGLQFYGTCVRRQFAYTLDYDRSGGTAHADEGGQR
jgi:hypothetical protein